MVQHQVVRRPIILLESPVRWREHGYVTVHQGIVGHVACLQKLIKLQQKANKRCQLSHKRRGAWLGVIFKTLPSIFSRFVAIRKGQGKRESISRQQKEEGDRPADVFSRGGY